MSGPPRDTPPGAKRWLFDAWSYVYDLPIVQRLTYRPVHDAVLHELREEPPRTVLDLGCGTGLLSQRIGRELPRVRVVGCDFSLGMLRSARANGEGSTWVQGDAQRLPFRDARFDALVSTEAFHWFPDQPAAQAECFRVLAPGGRLLVALMTSPLELVSDALHLGSRLAGQPFYWPTPARMRVLVEGAGFRVQAQRRVYRLLPAGLAFPPVLTVGLRPQSKRSGSRR